MDARDIALKWETKTLTLTDIARYIEENIKPMDPFIFKTSITVAADICWELYEYNIKRVEMGEIEPLSVAILKNDLDRALDCCDLNMRHGGLWIVQMFMFNCAPRGWNKK